MKKEQLRVEVGARSITLFLPEKNESISFALSENAFGASGINLTESPNYPDGDDG